MALAKNSLLNKCMAALGLQLASLSAALDVSKKEGKAREVEIAELHQRLDATLTGKARPLKFYWSEFFGELRQVLADQPGARVVDDRFGRQNES